MMEKLKYYHTKYQQLKPQRSNKYEECKKERMWINYNAWTKITAKECNNDCTEMQKSELKRISYHTTELENMLTRALCGLDVFS